MILCLLSLIVSMESWNWKGYKNWVGSTDRITLLLQIVSEFDFTATLKRYFHSRPGIFSSPLVGTLFYLEEFRVP
jgi:hypothetical protein